MTDLFAARYVGVRAKNFNLCSGKACYKKTMMKKFSRVEYKLNIIHCAASFVVWSFFIHLLFSYAYLDNYSPIMLGILSLCFSGTMALINGVAPGMLTKKNGKIILILGIILNLISIITISLVNSYIQVIVATIIQGASYSLTSTSINSIIKFVTNGGESDFVFKLFRVIGPMLGGFLVSFLSDYLWYILATVMSVILVMAIIFKYKNEVNTDISKKEDVRYIITDKYEKNDTYTNILLIAVAVITFGIQVIDAQLITVLKETQNFNSLILGLCIGGSGVGVFMISIFLERYMRKEQYFLAAMFGFAVLLAAAGRYLVSEETYLVIPLLSMFFIGGILWQTIMSVLENIIKSYQDMTKRDKKFTVVGIILLLSYSMGAIISGFLVNYWGIGKVYIILGMIIFLAALFVAIEKIFIFRKVS